MDDVGKDVQYLRAFLCVRACMFEAVVFMDTLRISNSVRCFFVTLGCLMMPRYKEPLFFDPMYPSVLLQVWKCKAQEE
jgi:hypothetical protein